MRRDRLTRTVSEDCGGVRPECHFLRNPSKIGKYVLQGNLSKGERK